jgi:hypothetical protein
MVSARTYTSDVGVLGRVKTELQTHGVVVPPALQEELTRDWNAPAIGRGRFVFLLENKEFGLYTTVLIINGHFSKKSPYHMVKSATGAYEVWKDDEKFTDVSMMPRPKYYDLTTTDGIPMSDVAVIGEPDHLRSVLNQRCGYQRIGKACKFCAIESWWAGYMDKTPAQVAEVAEAAAREGMISMSPSAPHQAQRGQRPRGRRRSGETHRPARQTHQPLNFEPLTDTVMLEKFFAKAKSRRLHIPLQRRVLR